MIRKEDVLVDGSDWFVSLTKLTGKTIKDIEMYPSMEFGEATLKVCWVIFEDGTRLWVEGEHDFPYVVDYSREDQILPAEEDLYDLYKQLNDEEEE